MVLGLLQETRFCNRQVKCIILYQCKCSFLLHIHTWRKFNTCSGLSVHRSRWKQSNGKNYLMDQSGAHSHRGRILLFAGPSSTGCTTTMLMSCPATSCSSKCSLSCALCSQLPISLLCCLPTIFTVKKVWHAVSYISCDCGTLNHVCSNYFGNNWQLQNSNIMYKTIYNIMHNFI